MPNRIIKETIRTSRSANALSDFEFRLFVHLITYADDYGRGSADPELIKGMVFPRRKGVTEAQIAKALDALATVGIVSLYIVDGEPFFQFSAWSKHQQIRAKVSKFPAPEGAADGEPLEDDITCKQMISNDSKCNQMLTDASVIVSGDDNQKQSSPDTRKRNEKEKEAAPSFEEAKAKAIKSLKGGQR